MRISNLGHLTNEDFISDIDLASDRHLDDYLNEQVHLNGDTVYSSYGKGIVIPGLYLSHATHAF